MPYMIEIDKTSDGQFSCHLRLMILGEDHDRNKDKTLFEDFYLEKTPNDALLKALAQVYVAQFDIWGPELPQNEPHLCIKDNEIQKWGYEWSEREVNFGVDIGVWTVPFLRHTSLVN